MLDLPSNLISTGTLLDQYVFNTKTDFLSGSQSKASHGHPNGQSALNRLQCSGHNVGITWQGHVSYSALKLSIHVFSQAWLFWQSMIQSPKSMLFSFLHVSKLSLSCGVGLSPQIQNKFGQSRHPFGQLELHGQS